MLKYSVIVPVNYNDGTEIPPELIQEFEFEVMVLTGGITRESMTEGKWLGVHRETYIDKGIKYAIAVTEENLPKLQNLVRRYMKAFGQVAYYREIDRQVDVDVEMVD